MGFMDEYWGKNILVGKYGIDYLDRELLGISKSDLVVIGAKSGCVDGETEFFNGQEWKKISEYREGELVLQADMQTQKASLVVPLQYIKLPCDKWYVFRTKYGLDMKLSAEHNIVYKTCCGNYMKDSAENVYKRHTTSKRGFGQTIPTSFDYAGSGIDLSDEEIKLMIAVIADGSFPKDRKICSVHLKKEKKQKELKQILDNLGIKYRWYERPSGDGYVDVSFFAPRREKVFSSYWYGCNKHQLELICENVLKWDGAIDEKGRKRFFATEKQSADFVQFAFSACGYRATIRVQDRRGRIREIKGREYTTKSIDYVVTITNRTDVGIKSKTTKTCWEELTNDTKYCFTVPSHCLVLRRNGKIFITGNSGKSSLARIIYRNNDSLTTALFSLENFEGDIEAEEVRKRYNAAAGTFITPRQWQTAEFCPNKSIYEVLEKEVEAELNTDNIFGRKTPGGEPWTVETLKQEMIRVASQGVKLIILDHLDYLDRFNPNESDNSHVTELMKMIRDIQETYEVAVVAFSHLRKPLGKIDDLVVPSENEFIGSSNKIKQATQVVMIAPAGEGDAHTGYATWICIRKNRNGGIKNIAAKTWFDPMTETYHGTELYKINFAGTKATPLEEEN